MIEGKTEQETVELTMYILGVSRERAEFIIVQERGEIDGDEVVIQPGQGIPE